MIMDMYDLYNLSLIDGRFFQETNHFGAHTYKTKSWTKKQWQKSEHKGWLNIHHLAYTNMLLLVFNSIILFNNVCNLPYTRWTSFRSSQPSSNSGPECSFS